MSDVNFIQELSEAGLDFEFEGENHVKLKCPFHDDTGPSFSMRLDNGKGHCFACGFNVHFVQFLSKITDRPNSEIEKYLIQKYNLISDEASISPQVVDSYTGAIWNAEPLLLQLRRRGVGENEIKKYRLGVDKGRITIPIFTASGRCANLIKYLPNATKKKFQNAKGRGALRLYPVDQLTYDKMILTGGPIKAIAGTACFNQENIGVVTATGGEHDWNIELSKELEGKTIYIIFDVDGPGQKAAADRAISVYAYAKEIKIINLEFPVPDDFLKGGLDDYLALAKEKPELLEKLKKQISETELWIPPQLVKLENTTPIDITVTKAFNPNFIGHRLRMPVTITAVSETPYFLPKDFTVTCSRDAKPDGICAICPVATIKAGEEFTATLNSESKNLLPMLDNAESYQFKLLAKEAGIPASCNRHTIKKTSHQIAEDIRISPLIDLKDTDIDKTDQPAILLGRTVEPNGRYELTGRTYPHPNTQKATFIASEAKGLSDNLAGWKLDEPAKLNFLRPEEWTLESLEKKLDEIYLFFERHVTRIYNRRDMHIIIDLAYHSCLYFSMDEKEDNKGWVEVLIIGDSSQGKSDCISGFRNFYGLGDRIDCKNASVAGLLGGNEQLNGKFFVKWGKIPKNDMGLVILEEIKGAEQTLISKLTDMRSSGVAQLPKIESKTAKARTRWIVSTNQRSKRTLSTYTYGVDAISELIGAPEDIRRFDAAIAINKDDNKPEPNPEHNDTKQFSQKELRDCVLNAWTVKDVNVENVQQEIREAAARLCIKYVEERTPLIDKGSIRLKIARLSIALALRTFSNEVFPCHVQYIEKFLNRIYSGALGYDKYSKSILESLTVKNPEAINNEILKVPFAIDLVENLREKGIFEIQDIMQWGGVLKDQAESFIGTLVRCKAVERKKGNAYVKTSGFVDFLNKFDLDDPSLKPPVTGDF